MRRGAMSRVIRPSSAWFSRSIRDGGDVGCATAERDRAALEGAMFVLVKVVEGPLKGEKYLLTNTSDKPMVIDERELYRRGVVAIAIEKPELKPAETTAVYVVSENAE